MRIGVVQQLLVAFQALCGRATHNRGDRAPLCRHELSHVQELLIFFARPLDFLDRRIQPFVPPRFALLGRLAHEQRRDTRPLIHTILGHGSLEDLILGLQ